MHTKQTWTDIQIYKIPTDQDYMACNAGKMWLCFTGIHMPETLLRIKITFWQNIYINIFICSWMCVCVCLVCVYVRWYLCWIGYKWHSFIWQKDRMFGGKGEMLRAYHLYVHFIWGYIATDYTSVLYILSIFSIWQH